MTVWEHYDRIAEAFQDRPAVIDQQGETLTHGQLRTSAAALSGGLAKLGLGPGDHVGAFLPNRVIWPVLAFAAAHRGVGVLGLNTRFREAELNHLLSVAKVDTVIAVDRFLGTDGAELMSGLDRPVRTVIVPISSDGVTQNGNGNIVPLADLMSAPSVEPSGGADHPLIGFTTSGTTGFPKIAMHTQRQTLSQMFGVIDAFTLDSSSVSLTPLPLCGAFGYTVAIATLLAGGTVVAHETWDPDAAASDIDTHGVTYFSASDDMLLSVFASDGFNPEGTWTTGGFADFTNSGLSAVITADELCGGRLPLTGLYGSSEGFAVMSSWDPSASQEERTRNGGYLACADMDVRCCDPETGDVLESGQPGELQFRGPTLITGYMNNPEATEKAFTDDGWYRSGDLGYTVEKDDRGRQGLVYLSRLGDSLRLRGFLCDPAEIENHLECHQAVELAQVVGVKRPGLGDVAVAFVRLTGNDKGEAVDEAALLAHCSTGLANYKRPERIVIVDDFPVTDGPNGVKIRKVELRAKAQTLIG